MASPCSILFATSGDGDAAVLVAFDLIELEGEDLRRSSIDRKRKLAKLVRRPQLGIVLNEHESAGCEAQGRGVAAA